MTRSRAVLLAIILIAFALRMWDLPQTPPGLWYDEAYNAMDALWMAQTGQYQLFMVGNNGREPLWHYLLIGTMALLGHTTLAVRWAGSIAGFLTVPIMYSLARSLLSPFAPDRRQSRWLALAATGLLAVSWWHLLNSRAGFRPVLLPPLLMLSLYFWMKGVRSEDQQAQVTGVKSFPGPPILNFALAGFFLGLSQYTYLPARLSPLIFGGLVILWSFLALIARKKAPPFQLRGLWLGLLITTLVAALVFLPLGLFFLNNPDTFSSRTGDVLFSPDNFGETVSHLWEGITLFLGAGHVLFRHHLPGRAMLGWLEIPFFWLGLIFLLHPARLRRPETHLILIGLAVMWLPALLASPPIHSLRPIGLLPFYYLIVTLGLFFMSRVTYRVSSRYATWVKYHAFPVLAALIIALNGLINIYDYFWRWSNHPTVYEEYNGPLVDLTRHLISLTQTDDVIIPFHLYAHPTTRYLLWDTFPEIEGPPPPSSRAAEMLLIPSTFQLLYVGNIPESPALVLLTRDESGRGAAYVSRPPRADEQIKINELLLSAADQVKPFEDKFGREVAGLISLPSQDDWSIARLFDDTPLRKIQLNWADLVQLDGYDVTPQLARSDQPITLNLYWHSLTDRTFDYRLFLQLLDGSGNPINQWEGNALSEDMYRWRPDGILPTQHTLWLGADTPPGPYLIRVGFFDERSGERLPLLTIQQTNLPSVATDQPPNQPPLDQIQLGLFYVSSDGTDLRQPATPLSANFADSINLIGVTLPDIYNSQLTTHNSPLPVTFHWQARQPTDRPYTVFLQLLNQQEEVVCSWDGQPFGGLYPTNLWSPGEIIADTFYLPLPEGGLSPGAYRLITGLYDVETGQRLPVVGGGDFAELGEFVVD